MKKEELRYLQRLAELYPTIDKASTEIINLQSILNLPKGTEHFLSDLHGEYEAFSHVLRNGSGAVRKKIDDVFGHTLSTADKRALATLIYYPKEKTALVKKGEEDMENWYKITLYRLIEVCKTVSSKYTRSKVRKALPEEYAYVIEELITEKSEVLDKEAYYDSIVNTIIDIGRAEDFIVAMGELIQRLVVDHLHILGDIYDRGPGPHFIMDRLMEYHSLDIQWGNHDVVWMGAAAGQRTCIANIVRVCARYDNLDILEDGYGINLLPLATFAMNTYKDDPCTCFKIRGGESSSIVETKLT
ncbi:MAG: fructose-bisphosphatase class III, partial [Blautia sp.]